MEVGYTRLKIAAGSVNLLMPLATLSSEKLKNGNIWTVLA
jgi:hypothetical protein